MTGCRIGRVKLKSGGEIIPFPKKNLILYDNSTGWNSLKQAHELIKNGDVKSLGIVIVMNDGSTYTDFNMKEGYNCLPLVGALQKLISSVLDWEKA